MKEFVGLTLNDSIYIIKPGSRIKLYQDGYYFDTLEWEEYKSMARDSHTHITRIAAIGFDVVRIDV